ncbi:MAG: hypothetical protein Q8Q81_00570 [Oxalobacteraceae bacterium]|nr:hypothetical protein [Oxalobacteraceae bacterium]
MNLYQVQAIGPVAKRHRGIVGETDAQAIAKAQARHERAGHALIGHQFKVIECRLIVCGSALQGVA